VCEVVSAALFGTRLRLTNAGQLLRRCVQPQRAPVAVENDGSPARYVEGRGSTPASTGRPSDRARIATCEVAPPRVVQKPSTRERSSAAVSDGVRSSAMWIEFGG
jgi:hypothetical protein